MGRTRIKNEKICSSPDFDKIWNQIVSWPSETKSESDLQKSEKQAPWGGIAKKIQKFCLAPDLDKMSY